MSKKKDADDPRKGKKEKRDKEISRHRKKNKGKSHYVTGSGRK